MVLIQPAEEYRAEMNLAYVVGIIIYPSEKSGIKSRRADCLFLPLTYQRLHEVFYCEPFSTCAVIRVYVSTNTCRQFAAQAFFTGVSTALVHEDSAVSGKKLVRNYLFI